jgi:hypothetical protein
MGWRGTLAALGLLLISAAGYFCIEAPTAKLGDLANRSGPEVTPLIPYALADIEAIALSLEGDTRTATRRGNGWIGCDRPEMLDDLILDLGRLGALSEIDAAPAELNTFGLDPPRGTMQIHTQARVLTIEVGSRNPSTTGVYLRFPEANRIVLAGALVAWQFENAFRALTPGPATPPKQ